MSTDFWTLDALWWYVSGEGSDGDNQDVVQPESGGAFGLERQLKDFLLENWERTPLATEWAILSTPEDPEAGNQFPTDVGRIDILAKHTTDKRLLVIELKRNQSTDQTVAQALRYVGWVTQHLASDGERVEALIISHKIDKDLQYAILTLPNFRLMTYEVEFKLNSATPLAI